MRGADGVFPPNYASSLPGGLIGQAGCGAPVPSSPEGERPRDKRRLGVHAGLDHRVLQLRADCVYRQVKRGGDLRGPKTPRQTLHRAPFGRCEGVSLSQADAAYMRVCSFTVNRPVYHAAVPQSGGRPATHHTASQRFRHHPRGVCDRRNPRSGPRCRQAIAAGIRGGTYCFRQSNCRQRTNSAAREGVCAAARMMLTA
jgi:hypothetical protein